MKQPPSIRVPPAIAVAIIVLTVAYILIGSSLARHLSSPTQTTITISVVIAISILAIGIAYKWLAK